MTDLDLATVFTGLVILIWGFRSLRNRKVNALFFKLRGRHSTWIFGFVSVISGLLMLLSGFTAANSLSAERVETFARSGLYVFGIGWALALIMEVIDRLTWRSYPHLAPEEVQVERKRKQLDKRKNKPTVTDWVYREQGTYHGESEKDAGVLPG